MSPRRQLLFRFSPNKNDNKTGFMLYLFSLSPNNDSNGITLSLLRLIKNSKMFLGYLELI